MDSLAKIKLDQYFCPRMPYTVHSERQTPSISFTFCYVSDLYLIQIFFHSLTYTQYPIMTNNDKAKTECLKFVQIYWKRKTLTYVFRPFAMTLNVTYVLPISLAHIRDVFAPQEKWEEPQLNFKSHSKEPEYVSHVPSLISTFIQGAPKSNQIIYCSTCM